MKNKKTIKFEKGKLYIAICCFALIAAAIGFFGQAPINTENESQQNNIANNNIEIPQIEISETPQIFAEDETSYEKKNEEHITIPEIKPSTPAPINEEEVSVSNTVTIENPEFLMPVDGKVVYSFSGDKLIYNEILGDWRTHNGIDISCDSDSAIYATAGGTVTDIYQNSMGKNVKIDHQNGYISIYSNLSDTVELSIGDIIEAHDLIGKAGNSSVGDFTSGPHLHFEIIKDSKYIDPITVLS